MAGSNIRKRSDGRYELRFTVNGKRYSVYGATRKECKDKEFEKRQDLVNGLAGNKSTITVNQYFDLWERSRKDQVKPATIQSNRSNMVQLLKLLGNYHLAKIDRITVLDTQKLLAKKLEASSVNAAMTIFKSMCNSAILDGVLTQNPCVGVRRLRITKQPARETIHRALTLEEQKQFLQAARNTSTIWYEELFEFALLTGLRIGEIGALTWENVDRSKKLLRINQTITRGENGEFLAGPPKTITSRRVIPLTSAILSVLDRQKKKTAFIFGKRLPFYVFTAPNGGIVYDAPVNKEIKKICIQTGIVYFSVHAFRDTFATNALRDGMSPNTLKEIMGHSSYSMTMDLYAHVLEDTKRAEMNKIHLIID